MDYLALRFSTLLRELHWVKDDTINSLDLLDRFDNFAHPFGFYLNEGLIAAARFIPVDSVAELPSGQFIPAECDFKGRVAEISKVCVQSCFRNFGLFTALLLRCKIEARVQNIRHVFIAVVDSEKVRNFLITQGFNVFGNPFMYDDGIIAPNLPAILFYLDLDEIEKANEKKLYTNLHSVCQKAYDKIHKGSFSSEN